MSIIRMASSAAKTAMAKPAAVIASAALPMSEADRYRAIDSVLREIGDAVVVCIGEASHGSHEFYQERAKITQRLIAEKGFSAVCWEADWPDTSDVNRFVRGQAPDEVEAVDALSGFARWPQWMWRNSSVLDFVGWLRDYNESQAEGAKCGVYGLDLYSMYTSMGEVVRFLDKVDRDAASRARYCYSCFEDPDFEGESQQYGRMTGLGLVPSCERDALKVLVQLQQLRAGRGRLGGGPPSTQKRDSATSSAAAPLIQDGAIPAYPYSIERSSTESHRPHWPQDPGLQAREGGGLAFAEDEAFYAEENARLVVDAEAYYREMFRGRVSSWNLRDKHMFSCLQNLRQHLLATGRSPKIIVWAHNSHLGDARATEMGRRGEFNVGQLVSQAYPAPASYLIGFSTYSGTVTAASAWDGLVERKHVRPAMSGSYEALFHEAVTLTGPAEGSVMGGQPVQSHAEHGQFMLHLRDIAAPSSAGSGESGSESSCRKAAIEVLSEPRLERAIGVIYKPETERQSHMFTSCLPKQFNTIIHIDRTRALEPLERTPLWNTGEAEETFPTGL